MARRYVPDAGDNVWLCFDQQAGHEQAGHSPVLGKPSVALAEARPKIVVLLGK